MTTSADRPGVTIPANLIRRLQSEEAALRREASSSIAEMTRANAEKRADLIRDVLEQFTAPPAIRRPSHRPGGLFVVCGSMVKETPGRIDRQNCTSIYIAADGNEATIEHMRHYGERFPGHLFEGIPAVSDVSNVARDFVRLHG